MDIHERWICIRDGYNYTSHAYKDTQKRGSAKESAVDLSCRNDISSGPGQQLAINSVIGKGKDELDSGLFSACGLHI